MCATCALLLSGLNVNAQVPGSTCLAPIVVEDTSTPITISDGGEHWFKISVDMLPMGVFYPSDVTGQVLTATVDFHCSNIPYQDRTLEAAIKQIEKDNGVTLPFTLRFEETTRNGRHGYELIISNKYKTLLFAYGIMYEVFAYVNINIPEVVVPEEPIDIEPIPEEELNDCMEDAQFVRVGDTESVGTRDSSSVYVLPLTTWQADTVVLHWSGDAALRIYMGANCKFAPVRSDEGVAGWWDVPANGYDTIAPAEMAELIEVAGIGEVSAKMLTAGSAGKIAISRMEHSTVVDRDGLTKATAFEFDWRGYNEQPAGTYWYHLQLDTLYDYDSPSMAYHIVNMGDAQTTVTLTAQAAGEEESKDIVLSAGQDWYRSEAVGTLVRMKIRDVYYCVSASEPIRTYARLSENAISDDACLQAVAFDWERGNDQAGGQSKWYAIDMRAMMRSAERKDVVVSIENKSNVANAASIDISLNCPSTGVTSYSTTLAGRDTYTRTIGSGMVSVLADSMVYVRLESAQDVHVSAQVVDGADAPLWSGCGDAYRLLIGGDYIYPQTHIRIENNVRDTAQVGDTLLYKIKVADLKERKMLPEVTMTNLNAQSAVTVYAEVAFECPVYSVQTQSATLGAGATVVRAIDKSMVDGVNAEYIYVRLWANQRIAFSVRLRSTNEGVACQTAKVFEWNRDVLQSVTSPDTETTVWYAIGLNAAKASRSDVLVRITNRSSSTANVRAEIAFECPYSDTQVQTRSIGAGQNMERVLDYSTFGMLGSDTIYIGVTSSKDLTLYGELQARAHVEADSACMQAVALDWENGHRIVSASTKDTTWIAIDMQQIRNTTLQPMVVVTNHCQTSLLLEGMLVLECPDSIGGQKKSITLQGDSVYTRELSRDLLKNLDENISQVYLRIIASGACVDYSFRVEMVQPDAGSSCATPISFNWVSGHDQAAGKELWYEIDLSGAKLSGDDISLLIRNKTNTACSLEAAFAPECPCDQPQAATIELGAAASITKTIPHSMFESFGDRVWLRIRSCTDIHFEAQTSEPAPFDVIACPDEAHWVDFDFNTLYHYPAAGTSVGDTVFYYISSADLQPLKDNSALSVRSHVVDDGCGAQTIDGMMYYHCPVVSQPMKQTLTLSAGQEIYKLVERAMLSSVLDRDTIIVMMASDKCFAFEAEIVNPNSGQDCQHAIRGALDCYVQEADATGWYRFDVEALSKLDTMLTVEVVNLSNVSDRVTIDAYSDCGGELLLSRSMNVAGNDTVRRSIPADMLLGVNSDYAYLRIYTSQQTKICLQGRAYDPFDTIRISSYTEVVPNIVLSSQEPDSAWYSLNIGALLADECWDSLQLSVTNTAMQVSHLYGELSWDTVVTHTMADRRIDIAAGARWERTLYRSDLDGLRSDMPFVRLTADQPIDILLSATLCEQGSDCATPIAFDWQYGNMHQSEDARWYHIYIDADTVAAHDGDDLKFIISNLTNEPTSIYADVYGSCMDRYPMASFNASLQGGAVRERYINTCALGALSGDLYICYRSNATTRIKAEWSHAREMENVEVRKVVVDTLTAMEWRGQVITAPGIYRDTVRYSTQMFTCDSARYILNVVAYDSIHAVLCYGESMDWRGEVRDAEDIYRDTVRYMLPEYGGADSAYYVLDLRVLDMPVIVEQTDTMTQRVPYLWRCKQLLDAGVYYDTVYSTLAECVDTVYTMTLVEQIAQTVAVYDTICHGDTLLWQCQQLYDAGDYNDTLYYAGTHNDSLYVTMHLNVLDSTVAAVEQVVLCYGDSLLWRDGEWHKETGVYNYQTYYPEPWGCDSILYTLDLRMHDAPVDSIFADTLTQRVPYLWRCMQIEGEGTYYDTVYAESTACIDTLFVLELVSQLPDVQEVYDTICRGDTLVWQCQQLHTTGDYNDTLYYAGTHNDSLYVTMHLNVLDSTVAAIEHVVLCNGDSLLWRDANWYKTSGTYFYQTYYPEPWGCDSVLYTLYIDVLDVADSTETMTICDAASYSWRGNDYEIPDEAFTQTYTFTTSDKYANTDCDSVRYTLHLNVLRPIIAPVEFDTVCESDLFNYRWKPYEEEHAGFRGDTLLQEHVMYSQYDCDSIVYELRLLVHRPVNDTPEIIERTICYDDSTFWISDYKSVAGTYLDTIRYSGSGCDSMYVQLNLTVRERPDTIWDGELRVCEGSLVEWRSHWIGDAGVHIDTEYYAGTQCDSLYHMVNLVVLSPIYGDTTVADFCAGSTYVWRGKQYDEAGVYYDTLKYQVPISCDSIIYTLQLSAKEPIQMPADTAYICNGESMEWFGQTYNQTGTYYHTIQYVELGCDSAYYTLHLEKQAPMAHQSDTLYICGSGSVTWTLNNRQYTGEGVYYDTLQTAQGCDSIAGMLRVIKQQVTIAPSEMATIYEGDVYVWHGSSYDEAGTYGAVDYYQSGCDSVIYSLTLTVLPAVQRTITDGGIVCAGTTVIGHDGTSHVINTHTEWTEMETAHDPDGTLVQTTYEYSYDVYDPVALPAASEYAAYIHVTCGTGIFGVAAATHAIEDYVASQPNFAPNLNDEALPTIHWYMIDATSGAQSVLDTTEVLNGDVLQVTLRCELQTECGDTWADHTFVVQGSTDADKYVLYENLPAINKYNGTMYMLDWDAIVASYSVPTCGTPNCLNDLANEQIEWYKVVGEMDDLNDPNYVHNDILVGTGKYYVPDMNARDEMYYAVLAVEKPSSETNTCGMWVRTTPVGNGANGGLQINPNPMSGSQTAEVRSGSMPYVASTIKITDIMGVLIQQLSNTSTIPSLPSGTYVVVVDDIYYLTLIVY